MCIYIAYILFYFQVFFTICSGYKSNPTKCCLHVVCSSHDRSICLWRVFLLSSSYPSLSILLVVIVCLGVLCVKHKCDNIHGNGFTKQNRWRERMAYLLVIWNLLQFKCDLSFCSCIVYVTRFNASDLLPLIGFRSFHNGQNSHLFNTICLKSFPRRAVVYQLISYELLLITNSRQKRKCTTKTPIILHIRFKYFFSSVP